MSFDEYEKLAREVTTHTDIMYKKDKVPYLVMAICGEAGEAANIVKKVVREHGMEKATIFFGSSGFMKNHDLRLELGDILWYASALAEELGYSLEEIARYNIEKLEARRAAMGHPAN
jgi:NTP pyrophosphatase (non-canonical NTP hydrolase)